MKPIEPTQKHAALSLKPPTAPRPAAPPLPAPSPQTGMQTFLAEFDQLWVKAQLESRRRIRALPPEAKGMVELQLSVNQLGLGTQLLTQTAEAVNGTLRRVQQLGSN